MFEATIDAGRTIVSGKAKFPPRSATTKRIRIRITQFISVRLEFRTNRAKGTMREGEGGEPLVDVSEFFGNSIAATAFGIRLKRERDTKSKNLANICEFAAIT